MITPRVGISPQVQEEMRLLIHRRSTESAKLLLLKCAEKTVTSYNQLLSEQPADVEITLAEERAS